MPNLMWEVVERLLFADLGDGTVYGGRVYTNADDYLHRTRPEWGNN
ncbi:hypothetical protein U9R62_07870 [Cylindrospermopsis raciborskii DSH]